jgi:dihydropteroate synthase
MGILNLTPDSFSDGGLCASPEAAVARARELAAAGADVLDLGAESTRPGHVPLTVGEELARLLPALAAVRRALPEMPLSVDTRRAEVAAEAVAAGADILNDIAGSTIAVAAATGAPLILMHHREQPIAAGSGGGFSAGADAFWGTLLDECRALVRRALDAGVAPEQLWLDPGFGFGKTPAQNLEVVRRLDRFAALGFPVLLAASRKSTIGRVLNAPLPASPERQRGTDAVTVWGIARGAAMVRVHDVAATLPVARMADALKQGLAFPF